MPLKLKNRHVIPQADYDTVHVLGLDIPLTRDLPFGGRIEMADLQTRHAEGEFGQLEYMMRVFCVFTRRLSKADHTRYSTLERQDLEPEEVTELVNGALALLTALAPEPTEDAEEAGEGNAVEKTEATGS